MNFWYNFDLLFNPGFGKVPTEIQDAYLLEFPLLPNWLIDRNEANIQNYPANFTDRIKSSNELTSVIKMLCSHQITKYNEIVNLPKGSELLEKAFEYFGQGVLFDDIIDPTTSLPRRPDSERVHMMDALHFGYPRWYVFSRAAVIAGENEEFWLNLSRLVALAYNLHKELDPKQSRNGQNPNNQEHPELAQELISSFKNSSFDQLDLVFDNSDVRDLMHM